MTVKILGLDWFEVVVQGAITVVFGVAADIMFSGGLKDVAVGAVLAGSLAVLGWRRRQAMVAGGSPEPGRLAELEDRVEELQQVAQRVFELEERLEFTERVLSQVRERDQARLPGS